MRLNFERPNGDTIYTDEGSGESVWVGSGTGTVISTAWSKNGAASLYIPSNAGYIETKYQKGNSISTGDFFFGGWFRADTGGSFSSRYLCGVDDGTAAGSAFSFYSAGSSQPTWIYSDGTTRTVTVGTGTYALNTDYYISMEKSGTTLRFCINGVVNVSTTFASNLHLPSARNFRIGTTPSGGTTGNLYCDMVQMLQYAPYGGAFTPPTSPI